MSERDAMMLSNPEGTVREALREYVGDGDGLDGLVLSHLVATFKSQALREAAEELDHSTDADVNNYIGRPRPTHSHTDRYADVRWLEARADQIERSHNDHP